jgi:hypothetical protein
MIFFLFSFLFQQERKRKRCAYSSKTFLPSTSDKSKQRTGKSLFFLIRISFKHTKEKEYFSRFLFSRLMLFFFFKEWEKKENHTKNKRKKYFFLE